MALSRFVRMPKSCALWCIGAWVMVAAPAAIANGLTIHANAPFSNAQLIDLGTNKTGIAINNETYVAWQTVNASNGYNSYIYSDGTSVQIPPLQTCPSLTSTQIYGLSDGTPIAPPSAAVNFEAICGDQPILEAYRLLGNGKVDPLPLGFDTIAYPSSMDSAGDISGYLGPASVGPSPTPPQPVGVIWPSDGSGFTELTTAEPYAIASNGSGSYYAVGGDYIYNSATQTLTTLPFAPISVNSAGTVVGRDSNDALYAAQIVNGVLHTILISSPYVSRATINKFGEVVGNVLNLASGNPTNTTVLWRPISTSGLVTAYKATTIGSGGIEDGVIGFNDRGQFIFDKVSLPSFVSDLNLYSLTRHGFDIAAGAGPVTVEQFKGLSSLGPYWDIVVVDTFQGQTLNTYANTQLTNAASAGLKIAAYVYLNFTGTGCELDPVSRTHI